LFASWGLILLFQLARSGNIDPPTSQGSLLAIAASAVGLAALGPALAALLVRRTGFYWLSGISASLTALFIFVLVATT